MYFCLYLFLLYIESQSNTVSAALQKKQCQVVGFVYNFLIHLFHTVETPGEAKQKFLQFLLCILWSQRCGGAQLKGMFLKLTELKGLTKVKKKGVSWVNLSLLIYYWWIEVASDGFLAWCDLMPRAEYFGRTRRHFWSPNRKQEPCVVINSEWIFVGSSVHRGVVNEISKGRIFSYCVSTSMLHISLGL